jgi:nucleotide-binding universal stress UspA family protein
MSKLDQFASAFKSAAKAQYQHAPVTIDKVMVMTDLPVDGSRRFAKDVEEFLRVIGEKGSVEWQEHHVSPGEDVGALLEVIERCRPKLICCYRNLHGRARSFPFSLGAQVDVLTQATTTPVLLLPAPTSENRLVPGCVATNTVMVLTDHLTGSDRLIDYGVGFASDRGALVLAHLEDDATFERYISTIAKIPALDTEVARVEIFNQLLKEPKDYIESVRRVVLEQFPGLTVHKEVRMGHHVSDCREIIDQHAIDLVVMNTKDEDQLAMHGLAYPLAIELRDLPLLLL